MKHILNTFLFIGLFLVTTQGNSQNYIGNEEDINSILTNIKEFSESLMNSDYQAIGNAYSLNAKIFPSDRTIISGREAIIKYWIPTNGTQIKYHKIFPEEIKILGDEAYDYGYYEGKSLSSDGNEFSWKGKYVILWKKINQQWLIYLDIWNRVKD